MTGWTNDERAMADRDWKWQYLEGVVHKLIYEAKKAGFVITIENKVYPLNPKENRMVGEVRPARGNY